MSGTPTDLYMTPLYLLIIQIENFSVQMGNQTHAESNPVEINMSSARKGEPGLAIGLTPLGLLYPFNLA